MPQGKPNLNRKPTNWTGATLTDPEGNRYEVIAVSANGFHLLLRRWVNDGTRLIRTNQLASIPVARADKNSHSLESGPWLAIFPPEEQPDPQQARFKMFKIKATITMPTKAIHDYTQILSARDHTHARHVVAYAIAAAWAGSTHVIESVVQLSDEEIAAIPVSFPA